ncbi:MAG TPA: DNA (cytosine-5-)-methyltransferase [Candidatus Bacteroides pullicola]|uniref:Cytosine-specific methyltransferase n=1 Tax=Candidatus Bacteroides pullicola TaxID=2838475 RepID=A0A9D1ZII0_9BACE|nr:DNA (cytosine-5-)-methyltransferase [Candidatus Bacteroides pullicola]
MTHASLFSGIGGAEIAATRMGWSNAFHCEINPFGRRVLEYWYPNSTSYEGITKTDFTPWRGRIDVLTGGFPCQPFSLAGQRRGAEDDRYLWPQMLRAIREIQPRWVVGENVAGILTMVQSGSEVAVGSEAALFGTSDRERVLLRQRYTVEEICESLEREGYAVQPFLIPACAVGAPHRRDRVWFVAHRTDAGIETLQCGREDGVHADGVAPDPDLNRQRERAYQQIPVTECQGSAHDSTCGKDGLAAFTRGERCDNRGNNRERGQIHSDQERDTPKGETRTERTGALDWQGWCNLENFFKLRPPTTAKTPPFPKAKRNASNSPE